MVAANSFLTFICYLEPVVKQPLIVQVARYFDPSKRVVGRHQTFPNFRDYQRVSIVYASKDRNYTFRRTLGDGILVSTSEIDPTAATRDHTQSIGEQTQEQKRRNLRHAVKHRSTHTCKRHLPCTDKVTRLDGSGPRVVLHVL